MLDSRCDDLVIYSRLVGLFHSVLAALGSSLDLKAEYFPVLTLDPGHLLILTPL